MLIVITSEKPIKNETQKIEYLFEAGLECLHIRKPNWTIDEYRFLLNQINSKYHHRIVVHHFHELINEFNLKGIHFPEQKRKDHIDNPGRYFKNLNMFGKTISSSFHEIAELEECYFEFDYHLLSPVFSSISKQGYEGRRFDVNQSTKKVIGMGGVTMENLNKFTELGFKGIGVLGSIWNSDTPVSDFKRMKNILSDYYEQLAMNS